MTNFVERSIQTGMQPTEAALHLQTNSNQNSVSNSFNPRFDIDKRLKTLRLAEKLGNISAACRSSGMDRTSFYEWRRRFQRLGVEGLENRSSAPKQHPFTTPNTIVEKVIKAALRNPEWGCIRISKSLSEQGLSLSSPTVQKILIQHNIGKRKERLYVLEKSLLEGSYEITPHQLTLLEQFNPSLRERHDDYVGPGYKLAQGRVLIGKSKNIGYIYLQLAVDCYNLHGFGHIHRRKHPQDSVFLLRNQVMPYYNNEVFQIETDNGPGYCGDSNHPYQEYLQRQNIRHTPNGGKKCNNNGHLHRLSSIINEHFIQHNQDKIKTADSVDELQCDLREWLKRYNTSFQLPGFPTFGHTPA